MLQQTRVFDLHFAGRKWQSITNLARSFPEQVDHDAASVRLKSMFPEINSLPRAQSEARRDNRDAEIHAGQRRANVRRHVVITLAGMLEERFAVRHEPGEEFF